MIQASSPLAAFIVSYFYYSKLVKSRGLAERLEKPREATYGRLALLACWRAPVLPA